MTVKKSELSILTVFAFLAIALEAYLASIYGIYGDELIYFVAISLTSLIGFEALGYITIDYLKKTMLVKHEWEVPLISSIIVIIVQVLFFLWIFSLVIVHPVFVGRTLDAFSLSLVMSFMIPGLIVAYFSKE